MAPPAAAELLFAPAHELAMLIASRALSAAELIGMVVARAQEMQPTLNCLAVPLYAEAMTAAYEADAAAGRGDTLGPLHGVPLTVKDGVATAGHPLAMGSASRANEVAQVDDIVWRRLKAAGAILIGKTTTPEFFHKVVTDSELFGVTRNPWSLRHTPGGSSGGAAAALAAGIGPVGVGSDGGGSLRCPAACTGILGLKPTLGRVPLTSATDTFANYAALGPMARDVRDLAAMLCIMSGSAPDDAASLGVKQLSIEELDRPGTRKLRVGWLAEPGGYAVDPEVSGAALGLLAKLSETHILVEPLDAGLLDHVFETYRVIASVGHAGRKRTQSNAVQALWSDSYRMLVEHGASHDASSYQAAQCARTQLFRRVQVVFETVDVIATPTLATTAKTVDAEGSVGSEAYAVWAAALFPFNLTGHPAISIPTGFSIAGLPTALQLVAPWYDEMRLLHLARAAETLQPWAQHRPAL